MSTSARSAGGANGESCLGWRSSRPDRGDDVPAGVHAPPTDAVPHPSDGPGHVGARGECGSLRPDTQRSLASGRPTSRPRPSR
jgi:hypothetical protein